MITSPILRIFAFRLFWLAQIKTISQRQKILLKPFRRHKVRFAVDLTFSFDTIFCCLSLTYGIAAFLCVLYSNFYCAVFVVAERRNKFGGFPK